VKVALLSDTHISAEGLAFNENVQVILRWIDRVAPDFVVHLGDVTAEGSQHPPQFELAAHMLSASKAPLRLVPGNHDIGDNPVARGAVSEHPFNAIRLEEYRRALGSDYWCFASEGWRIIGLNAQIFCTGTQEEARQFDWLESRLASCAGPVGLMLHKPLFFAAADDFPEHDRYVPLEARRRLLQILQGRDLRFVLSGHVHQARRMEHRGVSHIWMPSTSFCIPDAIQKPVGQKRVAAGLLTLTPNHFDFDFVTPPGLIRHNLLDHPEVYPQVLQIKARLTDGQADL
jgi:3',5'-cyclic AMP phosphodiesterase CpdA